MVLSKHIHYICNNTTSYCANEWDGIWIEGNSELPQLGGQNSAGEFEITNNSVVENARFAVNLRAPDADYPWPQDEEFYGGYVMAENSTFRNNGKAVAFWRYGTQDNLDQSSFTNVDFEDNSTCVSNWRSDGVTFNACSFSNFEETGILSFNSATIITNGCSFDSPLWNTGQELTKAIEIKNLHPSVSVPLIGHMNSAANNFNGGETCIDIEGANSLGQLIIQNNNFSNANTNIEIEGDSHFNIQSNTFVGLNNDTHDEGCVIINTGKSDNVNQNNEFTLSAYPLILKGQNPSYKFLNNCFDFIGEFDVFLTDEGSDGVIFNVQAGAIEGDPAGNNFSGPGTTNNAIRMPSNFVSFTYMVAVNTPISSSYYPDVDLDANGTNNVTIDFLGIQNNDDCGSTGFTGGGSTEFICNLPNTKSQLSSLIDELKLAVTNTANPTTLEEKVELYNYEKCLRAAGDKLLRLYAYDKEYSQAITKFQTDDFDRKAKVYGSIVDEGSYSMARNYLNEIPTSTEAETDFKAVQNIYLDLSEAGQAHSFVGKLESEERNDPRLEIVYNAAIKDNYLSCYARSLWFLMTGKRIEAEIDLVPAEEENQHSLELIKDFVIAPNPATNSFTIHIPDNTSAHLIEVIDMNGRAFLTKKVEENNTNIDSQSWSSGIYIVKIINEQGDLLWLDKIVKL